MTRRLRTVIAVTLFAATGLGLAPLLLSQPRLPSANLILITLDTTRADRLAPYGGPAHIMPTLDAWARGGVVFDDVSTVAPLTLPAHTSLMTGRTPPSHGVRDNAGRLADDVPTLAESLHGLGYHTGAFVSAVVLDKSRGLDRGFEIYDEVNRPDTAHRFRRPGNETVDAALRWLDTVGSDHFFLWIHLYDAHAPIRLAEPYRSAFGADPYGGALAFMDSQLGRIQAFLDARHLGGQTALVVAADHGESLGDHGESGHGIFVYQSVMHVPLIVTWPGLRAGRVGAAVQLTDVAPTVAALERAPQWEADGRSLAPLLGGRPLLARPIYTESIYPRHFGWSELRSLRSGTLKVIQAPRPELYDLAADPDEAHNLIDTRPGDAARLLAALRDMPGALTATPPPRPTVSRDLASLGYVSGAVRPAPPALLPDPKDMIGWYNRLESHTDLPMPSGSAGGASRR